MRKLFLLVLTFSFYGAGNAQFNFQYEKECGSPFNEGEVTLRKGKIIKILDGNTVVFKQKTKNGKKEPGEFTVHLAGIDSSVNEEFLRDFLVKNVLNKKGEVVLNHPREGEKEFFGTIWWAGGFGDLNRYLLQNGFADFLQPGRTPVGSYYTVCSYKQLALKAKKEKIGIWAK